MGRRIYVETRIRASMDELWRLTQEPAEHSRWDVRFTEIDYLPQDDEVRRFRYAVRFGPVAVQGVGRSIGERFRPDGARTSALAFESPDPLSPIASGRGYWRYVPTDDGIRFLTGYDYDPPEHPLFRAADPVVRALMGWGTAWSFDRLRLWLERGIAPETARTAALLDVAARCVAVVTAAAMARRHPLLALLAAGAAVLVRPAATVPSARRCLREPPAGTEPSEPTIAGRLS